MENHSKNDESRDAKGFVLAESTKNDTRNLAEKSTDPQSSARTSESRKDKTWLAIMVAVLSFLGAAAGTLISDRFQQARWEREVNYTANKEFLVKRIELLERTVKVVNQSNAAKLLNVEIQAAADLAKLGAVREDWTERLRPAVLRREELGVEYATTMSLVGLYFGPKTKEAMRKFTTTKTPWWDREYSDYDQLFSAMKEELQSQD